MQENNYAKDIEIDQDALDREFVNQPYLYMKYAELSARADIKARRAKDDLEVLAAAIYKEVVEESDKKPTDKAIQAEINDNKEYRELMHRYLELKYEADLMAAAVKAMEHKKTSLENLTKLWIGSYYSTPKQTNDSEEMKGDKRINRQRERLNRKRGGEE